MKRTFKVGFTLVEIVIAVGLMSLLLAGLISSFTHFRKVFSKQEEGTEMTQQAAMFLAYLRHDMANAAPSETILVNHGFTCTEGELSFSTFLPNASDPAIVKYSLFGRSLHRKLVGGQTIEDRQIISDALATLSWKLIDESAASSETLRIGVSLDFTLGGRKPVPQAEYGQFFRIRTNVFPVKWNRVLQNKQSKTN